MSHLTGGLQGWNEPLAEISLQTSDVLAVQRGQVLLGHGPMVSSVTCEWD